MPIWQPWLPAPPAGAGLPGAGLRQVAFPG